MTPSALQVAQTLGNAPLWGNKQRKSCLKWEEDGCMLSFQQRWHGLAMQNRQDFKCCHVKSQSLLLSANCSLNQRDTRLLYELSSDSVKNACLCTYSSIAVICYTPDWSVVFLFSFFLSDCSIIVTTVQYLSSALHKNFTETDFDFKVRTDTQQMLWHLFKLAVANQQGLFSILADYTCSIYVNICEEDDLTDKRLGLWICCGIKG